MSGATLWFILLYVLPALIIFCAAMYAVYSPSFSREVGITKVGDVVIVVIIGLIPVYNLWLTVIATYCVFIHDWWDEAKEQYLHRLLHD